MRVRFERWGKRSRVVLVSAAVAALLTASCSSHSSKANGGGDATTVPASTTPVVTDPCALVTLAQAESLVGGAELLPGLGVRTDDPTDRACTYTGIGDSPLQVEVLFGRRAQAAFDDNPNRSKLTAVPRIGHEAHEEAGAIYFRKKTTWVAIRVTGASNPAALRTQLEALARTVTPKI